jgi:hypothetical protein
MFRFRHRRHLDERVRTAREDVENSRRELERTREEIITPMARFRERNHFADLIRATLINGGPDNER